MPDADDAPAIPGDPAPDEASLLLRRAARGDADERARLHDLLRDELRALADAAMARERRDHTLQATALVHEAWLKLFAADEGAYADRDHFLAVSARAMRQVLVDHARGRRRLKRGGGLERVRLEEADPLRDDEPDLDLVALDAALEELRERSARQAEVVELRFFGGLAATEVARVLGVSERTVEREWRFAKAWLRLRLAE